MGRGGGRLRGLWIVVLGRLFFYCYFCFWFPAFDLILFGLIF